MMYIMRCVQISLCVAARVTYTVVHVYPAFRCFEDSVASSESDGKTNAVIAAGAASVAAATVVLAKWTQLQDEALVTLVQSLATNLGITPLSFDAIMLNPTQEDLSRYKGMYECACVIERVGCIILHCDLAAC
mgnify:CR=1 FL=1